MLLMIKLSILSAKMIQIEKPIKINEKIDKKENNITDKDKFKEIEQLIKKSTTTININNKINVLKSNENKNNKISFFKNENNEILKTNENKNLKINFFRNEKNELLKSIENKEIVKSNGNEIIPKENNIDLSLSEIPQDSQYLMTDIDLTINNNDDLKDNAFARRKFLNDLKYLANENSFIPMPKNNIKNNIINYDNISKNRYPSNILNLNANDTVYPQNKFNFKK